MDIQFRSVEERDIDLLVMDRVARGGALLELFVVEAVEAMAANPTTWILEGAQHSVVTDRGESDLVLVLSDGKRRHALLIENKIDAPPQHKQAARYHKRGEDGVSKGLWSSYSMILMAPQRYLDATEEPYPHKISYERITQAVDEGDEFGRKLLSSAIEKQKVGWQPVRDPVMSGFYDKVAETAEAMGVQAKCKHRVGQPRAAKTAWVEFQSPLADTSISWKSEQGFVALCFPGWAENVDVLKERIGEIPQGWYWKKWDKKVGTAYLCVDALYAVKIWKTATKDDALIADALEKVQAVYDYALQMNNRAINWRP